MLYHAPFRFVLAGSTTASQFLFNVSSIFYLRGEPAVTDDSVFFTFFAQARNAQSLEEVAAIDPDRALAAFVAANRRICRQQYRLKRKLRALFVAVLVQRRLYLRVEKWSASPRSFFQQAQLELFAVMMPADLCGESDLERESLVSFYIVLREIAAAWRPARKDDKGWETFAMLTASLAVGEGVWYCPVRCTSPRTLMRLRVLRVAIDADEHEQFFWSMVELVNRLEAQDRRNLIVA